MRIVETIIPIFVVILAGWIARRRNFIPEPFLGPANRIVFYLAIPAMIFRAIARGEFSAHFQPGVLVVTLAVVVAGYGMAWAACRASGLPPGPAGTFIQGAFHGNLGYIGLAVAYYFLGDAGLAAAGVVAGFMMILQNILAVLALSLYGKTDHSDAHPADAYPADAHPECRPETGQRKAGQAEAGQPETRQPETRQPEARQPKAGQPETGQRKAGQWKVGPAEMARRLGANPIILSAGAGIVYSAAGLPIPLIIDRSLVIMGGMALPMALLLIGASLSFGEIRRRGGAIAGACALKLLAMPALALGAFELMGISASDFLPALILLASPTATVVYVMSREMGGDADLAVGAITASTLGSAATFFVWLNIG